MFTVTFPTPRKVQPLYDGLTVTVGCGEETYSVPVNVAVLHEIDPINPAVKT
jgi:hypothetical protein